MHSQDDYSNIWKLGLYSPSGFNSVKNRQGDIHHHHIRSVCFDSLDGINAIPCLRNHLHVGLFLKHFADCPPIKRAVVNNHNANRWDCHYNSSPNETWMTETYHSFQGIYMGWRLYLFGRGKPAGDYPYNRYKGSSLISSAAASMLQFCKRVGCCIHCPFPSRQTRMSPIKITCRIQVN